MPGAILQHRKGGLPIIDCEISFPASAGLQIGTPSLHVKALVDTGATHIILNSPLVGALGLPARGPIDHTVVGHTSVARPSHLCDVILHGMRHLAPDHGPFKYTIADRLVVDDRLTDFDMILGWQVLEFIDISFSTNGTLTINMGK